MFEYIINLKMEFNYIKEYIYMFVYMCMCVYVCVSECASVCMYECMCACVSVCLWGGVCVVWVVYIHRIYILLGNKKVIILIHSSIIHSKS